MQQHKNEEIELYGDEYNLAITALREKQKRESEPCEWCKLIKNLQAENSALRDKLERTVEVTCEGCRFLETDAHKYYTFPCRECRRKTRDWFEESEGA